MRSTSTVPAPVPGALAGGSSWRIDPAHSHVEFAVRHLMISSVKGAFGDVQGTVWVDESDPRTVLVDVAIQVASIDTRQEQRDAHLRSPDFFDAAQVPHHHLPQPPGPGEPNRRRLPPDRRSHDPWHHARGHAGCLTRGPADRPMGRRAGGVQRRTRRSTAPTSGSPGTRLWRRVGSWSEMRSTSRSKWS